MKASEGELLRNQRGEIAQIVATIGNQKRTQLYEHECFSIADALLARFDVRLRVPQEEPFVTFTAMADDAKLVLHKVRIQGRIRVDGDKYADGSGITDCYFDTGHPSDVLPGVPFVEISPGHYSRVPQEEETP